ncbi:MAG: hypothetical protein V4628_17970 [Pseudomonadota bacterium]
MTEDEARIHLIALQLVDHEIMNNLLRFIAESQPDKNAFLSMQKEMVMKFLANSNMNDPHLLNVSAELAANVFLRAGLEERSNWSK